MQICMDLKTQKFFWGVTHIWHIIKPDIHKFTIKALLNIKIQIKKRVKWNKKIFPSPTKYMTHHDTVVLDKCTLLTFACIPCFGSVICMHQMFILFIL